MSKILQSHLSHSLSQEDPTVFTDQVLNTDPTLAELDRTAVDEMVLAARVESYKVPTLLNSAIEIVMASTSANPEITLDT